MYAVEMFFDNEIEEYVKNIWKELAEQNIDSSLLSIKYLRPHITLATYKNIELDKFKKQFISFVENFRPIDISFVTLGSFPSTGTVFTAPIISSDIFNLHKKYHDHLVEFKDTAIFYYLPDFWNPHCTFGIKLDQNKLLKVFEYCLSKFKLLKGEITEIGLVETIYENNICISSPRII